jgi:hypothetical protein
VRTIDILGDDPILCQIYFPLPEQKTIKFGVNADLVEKMLHTDLPEVISFLKHCCKEHSGSQANKQNGSRASSNSTKSSWFLSVDTATFRLPQLPSGLAPGHNKNI